MRTVKHFRSIGHSREHTLLTQVWLNFGIDFHERDLYKQADARKKNVPTTASLRRPAASKSEMESAARYKLRRKQQARLRCKPTKDACQLSLPE